MSDNDPSKLYLPHNLPPIIESMYNAIDLAELSACGQHHINWIYPVASLPTQSFDREDSLKFLESIPTAFPSIRISITKEDGTTYVTIESPYRPLFLPLIECSIEWDDMDDMEELLSILKVYFM